jgi:hypothetical protein
LLALFRASATRGIQERTIAKNAEDEASKGNIRIQRTGSRLSNLNIIKSYKRATILPKAYVLTTRTRVRPCWEETFGDRLSVTLTYKSGLHAANTGGRRTLKITTTTASTFQTLCPATSEEEDRTQIKERTFVALRAQTPSKITSHQCNRSQTLRVTQLSQNSIRRMNPVRPAKNAVSRVHNTSRKK